MRTHIVSGDHVVRQVTHREPVGEVGLQDIERALRNGERVSVIVRHAERPPLEKDDPTFGAELPITREGKIKADAFGFALKEFSGGFEHEMRVDALRLGGIQTDEVIFPKTIKFQYFGKMSRKKLRRCSQISGFVL